MDWLCERGTFTLKNNMVAMINDILLKSLESKEMEYRSVDTILQTDDTVHYPVEFLNILNFNGFPAHMLQSQFA